MWSHLPIGTGPSVTHRLRDPALIPTTKYSQPEQQSTAEADQLCTTTNPGHTRSLHIRFDCYLLLPRNRNPPCKRRTNPLPHSCASITSLTYCTAVKVTPVFLCVFQSVIRCLWHPKLNQIMVGTGNGLAKVYYDPVKSHRYYRPEDNGNDWCY